MHVERTDQLFPVAHDEQGIDLVFLHDLQSLGGKAGGGLDSLDFSRVIHTLASAIRQALPRGASGIWDRVWPGVISSLTEPERLKLGDAGLDVDQAGRDPEAWCRQAQDTAFSRLGQTIVTSTPPFSTHPRTALRSDEIVWGRAPARLDIGGGWTDTPPYALENGGCVINAAVDLNGQPPIQVYARIIDEVEKFLATR